MNELWLEKRLSFGWVQFLEMTSSALPPNTVRKSQFIRKCAWLLHLPHEMVIRLPTHKVCIVVIAPEFADSVGVWTVAHPDWLNNPPRTKPRMCRRYLWWGGTNSYADVPRRNNRMVRVMVMGNNCPTLYQHSRYKRPGIVCPLFWQWNNSSDIILMKPLAESLLGGHVMRVNLRPHWLTQLLLPCSHAQTRMKQF